MDAINHVRVFKNRLDLEVDLMVLRNPRSVPKPRRVEDQNRVRIAILVWFDVVPGDFLSHRMRRIYASLIDNCVAEIVFSLHPEAVSD